MRSRFLLFIPLLVALSFPATAAADFAHTVAPGESLASVAAADGLSVTQLAAANGISADSPLLAGSTIQIPPPSASVASGPVATGGETGEATADGDESGTVSSGTATAASGGGSYVVQPGDTLSSVAAANGLSVAQLAAANGLDPNGVLVSGTTLNLGGGGSAPAAPAVASTSSGAYVVQPGDSLTSVAVAHGMTVDQLAADNGLDPNAFLISGTSLHFGGSTGTALPVSSVTPAGGGAQPTAETVSPASVGQVAAANGVSPSLAEAIGYQESGFNNNEVSSTGATGVMQIEPGTWSYINRNLVPPPPLSPYSAQDNIRGGVLLLHSLLDQTGGDPALAAAGYYQGLDSVRRNGLYASTQQYVNDVMALRARFGGG